MDHRHRECGGGGGGGSGNKSSSRASTEVIETCGVSRVVIVDVTSS